MTSSASIRHIALKSLPLQMPDGERLVLQPGDEIPADVCGPWLLAAINGGNVVATPSLGVFDDAELKTELSARGYTVAKKKG